VGWPLLKETIRSKTESEQLGGNEDIMMRQVSSEAPVNGNHTTSETPKVTITTMEMKTQVTDPDGEPTWVEFPVSLKPVKPGLVE
jgi:hypothetical protein